MTGSSPSGQKKTLINVCPANPLALLCEWKLTCIKGTVEKYLISDKMNIRTRGPRKIDGDRCRSRCGVTSRVQNHTVFSVFSMRLQDVPYHLKTDPRVILKGSAVKYVAAQPWLSTCSNQKLRQNQKNLPLKQFQS